MKICFTGSQSTGKTSTFEALKNSNLLDGYSFISEHASALIDRYAYGTRDMQFAIFLRHLVSERKVGEKFVSDRCLLDCFAYYNLFGMIDSYLAELFSDLIKHSYDVFLFFPIEHAGNEFPYEHSAKRFIKGRKFIDDFIRNFLFKNKLLFYIVPILSIEYRAKYVVDVVKSLEGA